MVTLVLLLLPSFGHDMAAATRGFSFYFMAILTWIGLLVWAWVDWAIIP